MTSFTTPRVPNRVLWPGRMIAALLTLVAACKAPPAAESGPIDPQLPPPVGLRDRLGPDDVLQVLIYGHPDLSSAEQGVRVDQDGNVDLPLLGPVPVGGLTIGQARAAIEERATTYVRDPAVSVSVLEYAPHQFFVLGAVQTSGAYLIERPLDALQALSYGGGLRAGADHEQVALLRREDDRLEVRFFNAASPGPDGMVGVLPGDVIFVRQSGAGTFQDQIVPYIQGIAPPLAVLTSLILISDQLND